MAVKDKIDGERIYLPTSESNHIPHIFAYMMAIPSVKGKRVTDLCCGTGYGTRLLSEAAERVLGLDYSQTAIDYCRSRKLPNTAFGVQNIEELDKLEGDVITCMQGLEHLDNPKKLIQANLDKQWIVALPNDGDDTNEFHHHKIDEEMIQDWFGDKVRIRYFDDLAHYDNVRFDGFTNFLCEYRP
jgi:SAM-dependent methyltransferase